MEPTLRDVNSTIRTVLATTVVGAAGYGYYNLSYAPNQKLVAKERQLTEALASVSELQTQVTVRNERITDMAEELATQSAELERLDTALHLLKIDQRVAELRVLDQQTVGESVLTTVEFVETDPEGHPIGKPQRFDVPGDRVYVEYLVVKFNDELVEQADVERGTSIALFQRVFGNQQLADDGFTLDEPGTRPTAYARGGQPTDFEQNFWTNFWELAHNPAELKRLGVRALQGNAPFFKVRPGETYKLSLRTSGDFTMSPVEGDEEKTAEDNPTAIAKPSTDPSP